MLSKSITLQLIYRHFSSGPKLLMFQWYSWERLITGHDGDWEHAGAFIIGGIFYTIVAIGMAGLCAAFVFFLAPSAAGQFFILRLSCVLIFPATANRDFIARQIRGNESTVPTYSLLFFFVLF